MRLRPSLFTLPFVVLTGCAAHPPAAATAKPPAELPWIADDWPRALAAARAANHPIVVDLWATWCHYCTSAEGTTLRDPSVVGLRDRFVWARIDTDNPVNAGLLGLLKVQGLPDYVILDPTDQSIVGRWLGSATPEQFRNTLRDAERVFQSAHQTALDPNDPLRLFLDAYRAAEKGDAAGAAELLAKALKAAPAGWDRRDDAIDLEVTELAAAGKTREAVDLALSAIPEADHSSSAADAIATGAESIGDLPPATADLAALEARYLDRLGALAADRAAPIDTDVRVAVWAAMRDLRTARGESAEAKKCAEEELALLDAAAARAPDPLAASAYNSLRASLLVDLGRADDAIAMLKKSETDLPSQPDPPARLARVYEHEKRYPDALAEMDRAIAHASKKLAVELAVSRARILSEMSRDADACATLATALVDEAGLPEPQRDASLVERAKKAQADAKCAAR